MRIVDLEFKNNEIMYSTDKSSSWILSHKDIDKFASIHCKVGKREYYISCTKKLQNELDKDFDGSFSNLELVPLYRNCLLDYVEGHKFYTSLIKISTDVSEIADVKLENCYLITPFITDNGNNDNIKSIAFGISAQKNINIDFSIKIIRLDGKIINITRHGIVMEETKFVSKPKRIQTPKIIVMPKKSYIVDDINKKKDGYFSVHIFDILSRYSKIIEGNSDDREYLVCDTISDKYKKLANDLLKHSIKN